MIPKTDLFHQIVYRQDGYVAIANYTDEHQPSCDIYDPHGEWIGNSGASNVYTMAADIRIIINDNKTKLSYEQETNKRRD